MLKVTIISFFIIIFSLSSFTTFSINNNHQYTINYFQNKRVLEFYENRPVYINNQNKIDLNLPFNIHFKIKSIKLSGDNGIETPKYKRKKGHLTIESNIYKSQEVVLMIHFEVRMFFDRPILSALNYLYFPINYIQLINNQTLNKISEKPIIIKIKLPDDWIIFSHNYKIINENNEKYFLIEINNTGFPIIFAAKNIKHIYNSISEELNFHVFSRKTLEKIFINKEDLEKSLYNLFSIITYIEELTQQKLSFNELNLILINFIHFALNINQATLLGRIHIKALSKEEEQNQVYQVIHEYTLSLFQNKINPDRIDKDYWIIKGLAHTVAINYFYKKYNLELNQTNSNRFIKFLLGGKDSDYAQAKTYFRDYIRYGSLNSITNNNRAPILDYNYRALAINNHYSIQIFYHLKNLIGREALFIFIQTFLEEYKNNYLTTEKFLKKVKEFCGDLEYQIISRIIYNYPIIDYAIKRKKDQIQIFRTKGDALLPVEVEIIDDNNNKTRKIYLINDNIITLNSNNIKNVIVDPDSLIEEINESNNFLLTPVNFSFITPIYTLDKYSFAGSVVLCDYNDTTLGGGTISGAWNLKNFNSNSLNRPLLLWGIDCGYGYNTEGNFKNYHNLFLNLFFESSFYPLSVWSPYFYTYYFWLTGESMNLKFGMQGFFPPVINTEHDKIFFNHSWDVGFDIKLIYYPYGSIDYNLNGGYKIYFKYYLWTIEGIIAVNYDFDKILPKDLNIGTHLNIKLTFPLIEIGFRPGALISLFPYKKYEFTRPRFTRLSLVTQSTGYYELITKNLVYAKNLILDFPYPKMDFFFMNFYTLFRFILLRQPFLDSKLTLGFGPYIDINLPIPLTKDRVRGFFCGIIVKLDILKKISMILRGTVLPAYFYDDRLAFRIKNPIGLFFYEIKAYF